MTGKERQRRVQFLLQKAASATCRFFDEPEIRVHFALQL
jgi:hypothetical protein